MPRLRRLAFVLASFAAAAAWSGSALAAGEPANTSPPTISGRPQVGATLTAARGTWIAATSFSYQWQACDGRGAGCIDIPGAVGLTYVVPAGSGGATFQFTVTGSNSLADTAVSSAPSGVIGTFSLSTAHFSVHYQSDPATASAITQTQAGDIAALAEQAYTAELGDGYAAPPSDGAHGGDSRIDIYVQAIDEAGVLAYAIPETAAAQSYGYVILNGATPAEAFTLHTIAHELFHLIQFGIWAPAAQSDAWLLEGSAEWMGYRTDGFKGDLDLGGWEMALDCRDAKGTSQCDLEDGYKNGGYSRWPFFEYIAERWGADFTKGIFAQGPGAANATAALSSAVAAKNSSLADLFNDWTVANLTGAYSIPALQDALPPAYGTAISTGTLASINAKTPKGVPPLTAGPVGPVSVAVNHLSARYVAIRHGSASVPDGPCYKATLDLQVRLPAGVAAKPAFWWSQRNPDGTKQAAQLLAVSGDTASIRLPWDTCDWGSSQGYLALPNPTTDLDAQAFTISGTLSIDRSTQATATPPPDPVSISAPSVDASGAGTAPRIQVFGPQLVRLAAASRVLRVIVSSSDSGSLQASLGSLALGAAKLRPGNNDLRFALPERALRSLRSTSTAASALTLTPVSAGGAAGTSVVRRVAVEKPAVKPRLAPAPKTKPKAAKATKKG